MKRSIMLNHIRELIREELREGYNYNPIEFKVKSGDLLHLSEEILSMLEFQGMMPPDRGNINEIIYEWEDE